MRTFGPRLGRSGWVLLAVDIGACIAIVVYRPDQVLWVLAGVGLAVMIGWARLRAVRLEITDSVVRAKQGWYLPERQAAKGDITAIHYFPRVISFRGPDRKPMMRVAPNWSLRQMLEVADELGVPLYDHRRWLGLRKVSTGRLVNHPASSHPVR